MRAFSAHDAEQLECQVREKLADWRSLLRGAPQEARQILRVLLTEKLTFEPTKKDGQRLYRYRGTFTVGALFAGEMCPHMLASPTARNTSRNPRPLVSVGLDFDGAVRLAA